MALVGGILSSRYLNEITALRGLSMLGVIAIHVGSFALSNPLVSTQLIGFLEIATRFSIPAFFFLSAFGLCYQKENSSTFSYITFMKRRFDVVWMPYVVWSLLYLLYNAAILQNLAGFLPRYLLPTLLFGTGSYHLYFIVIIMYFYLLMPLWRKLLPYLEKQIALSMVILFLLQLGFNYLSSYEFGRITFTSPILQYLWSMRLNYWIFHYLFAWVLGMLVARRYDDVIALCYQHHKLLVCAFILAFSLQMGAYYYVLDAWRYTPLEAINTVHQLSPTGLIYTVVSIFFFLYLFHITKCFPKWMHVWQALGQQSFGMYLIHPFILIILTPLIERMQLTYTIPVTLLLYIATVLLSFYATESMNTLPNTIRRYLLGR